MIKLKKKILSKSITLDTSFIEAQNFLAGSKMNELSEICKKSKMQLYLTDIFYREVLDRFGKNLIQTEEKTKKLKDQLKTNARLLRNFADYSGYFNFPSIETEKLITRFKNDFDKWIEENSVEIISTDNLKIKKIFDDYFANKPPFKEGQKKHEFPDAFSLLAISNYFKRKQTKTYLLTSDKDILNYQNGNIIPIDDSAALFDLIIRTAPEFLAEKAIKLIEKEFESSKAKLETDTKEMIIIAIEDEFGTIHDIDELEIDCVNHVDISDIELNKFSIVKLDLDDSTANLECDINISFEVSFDAHDFSESWYDKEDDKWYFINSREFTIDDEYEIKVQLIAEFDIEDEYCKIEVEDIENGEKLDVLSSYKRWKY